MARIIRAILTNRYVTFNTTPKKLKKLKEYFRYHPQGYFWSPKYPAFWDGYRYLLQRNRVPTGLFLWQKDTIEKELKVKFKIKDQSVRPEFNDETSDTGREFQSEFIQTMIDKSYTGGTLLSATGTGKTFIAGNFFKRLKGYAVFIVDDLGLLDQTKRDIEAVLDEKVGVIGDSIFNPRRITVATIQTLSNHRRDPDYTPWVKKLDVAMIDEVHVALNDRTVQVINGLKPKAVYGLTATLNKIRRKDMRFMLAQISGPVIATYTMDQGIADKILTPGIYVRVKVPRNGDYYMGYNAEYSKFISGSKKYNSIVEKIIRHFIMKDKYVLALVDRVRHLKNLSKRLIDQPHQLAFGEKKRIERNRAVQRFEKGTIRLIIANRVFKKGTSIKRIDVIVEAAQGQDADDVQQKFGRGVRLFDNKMGMIYVDIGYCNADPDAKKGDEHFNRFEAKARKRMRAAKALKRPVYEITWKGSGKRIARFAIKKLKEHLKEHAKQSRINRKNSS